MKFEIVPFGDLYLEPSRNGLSRSSAKNINGTKIVNMGELFGFPRMSNPEMRRVESTDKENNVFGLQSHDLLFARRSLVAEGAGKCSIVLDINQTTVFESSIIRVRLDKKLCSPLFYYYYFCSDVGFGAIQTLVNEVAASGIRSKELAKLNVFYPNPGVQKMIAKTLNSYDELIEINLERVKILEETILETYKEWFVRMRFPNHKNTKSAKGVPAEWSIEKVKNLIHRQKFGKTYKANELVAYGKIIVIDQSTDELLGYHNGIPDHVATTENPMIIFGDHTCKIKLMMEPFSLAENVVPFSSKVAPVYFLFYLIKSLVETTEYKRHWTELNSKSVLLPTKSLQLLFSNFAKPFIEQISILQKQNIQIREIRDRLLPRLMSGKVKVKTMEDEVTCQ